MKSYLTSLLQSPLRLNQLKQVHVLIITKLPSLTPIFVKKLLDLSAVHYARKVFDKIPRPDMHVYNALVCTYSKLSMNSEALETFCSMHQSGTRVFSSTIPPVIKSCLTLRAIDVGKQMHSVAICRGCDSSVFVLTALMDFYVKNDDLVSARKILDGSLIKDPGCYNCLISGYTRSGDTEAARRLFDDMTERTVVSWNSMISCYTRNEDYREAIRIFERMQAENVHPSKITLVIVLSICAKLGDLHTGLRIRKRYIYDTSLQSDMILATAILELYVKCGAIDCARREFERMNTRDVVTWSAMFAGYAQNGRSSEAIKLFERMTSEQIKPDNVALISALSACAQSGFVEAGERIGIYVEHKGFAADVKVASALLDMHSKFGNIGKARQLFDEIQVKDVVSWNSMISGLAINGYAEDAIDLFEKMKEIGLRPDNITFSGLLTACTHAGLIEPGLKFFKSMKSDYRIAPEIEHHACVIDLLCRSGRLNDAYKSILRMEMEPNVVIWGTLLSASRTHLDVQLAEICLKKLLELEPEYYGNYILLSNLYASVGNWEEASKVRSLMKDRKLKKEVAYSCIAVENELQKFLVGDTSHPKWNEIFRIVNELAIQLTSAGRDLNLDLEIS